MIISQFQVNLYDLSRGSARQAPPTPLGREVEGVWHAGVVAYGREYSFTQHGVVSVVPVGVGVRAGRGWNAGV